jgi:predicted HTH domain antitoxin
MTRLVPSPLFRFPVAGRVLDMNLSIELPDPIARQMHLEGADGQRRALEMLALEGYRSEELSRGQVGKLLGMGFHETEEFLKKNRAFIEYTREEYEQSHAALERILGP